MLIDSPLVDSDDFYSRRIEIFSYTYTNKPIREYMDVRMIACLKVGHVQTIARVDVIAFSSLCLLVSQAGWEKREREKLILAP